MEKVFYKKSLKAKLILNREFSLVAYQAIKDTLSQHKDVKEKGSFDHELIYAFDKAVGMIRVGRKNVILYFAIDPSKVASKYKVIDCSTKKTYAKYPSKIIVDTPKALTYALELMERVLKNNKATEAKEKSEINYSEVLYERTFAELYKEGLIKQYVKKVPDVNKEKNIEEVKDKKAKVKEVLVEEEEDDEIMHKVTFTAKLLYCATNQAQELFIITNYYNWDLAKAVKMEKIDDNTFQGFDFYPEGTKLEFKICRATNWENVEKGIWKEEIVNHHYIIVDNDLEVEDLIHNFRID